MTRWLIGALLLTACGCGGDSGANVQEITPDMAAKIKAQDQAVDKAEGGKGSVRN